MRKNKYDYPKKEKKRRGSSERATKTEENWRENTKKMFKMRKIKRRRPSRVTRGKNNNSS